MKNINLLLNVLKRFEGKAEWAQLILTKDHTIQINIGSMGADFDMLTRNILESFRMSGVKEIVSVTPSGMSMFSDDWMTGGKEVPSVVIHVGAVIGEEESLDSMPGFQIELDEPISLSDPNLEEKLQESALKAFQKEQEQRMAQFKEEMAERNKKHKQDMESMRKRLQKRKMTVIDGGKK
jgi:transcriptional regulator of heat shock response